MVSRKGGRPSKYNSVVEGEYQCSPRETLDGKDYIQFMSDVLQARNDPVWFIEEILGFPGIDEQGNQRHMWPIQEHIIREFYQDKYNSSLPKVKRMAFVCGQRGSKTTTVGNIMAYELFETISWENPAQHYNLMVGKSGKGALISLTCAAVNRDQAKDGIFSNMRSLIEGNEWFEQWFDFTCKEQRIEFPKKNVVAQVLASKASNAAGRTNKFVGFDELDLFQDSETLIDASAVYDKLSNSTDTFGLDGKVVAISSLQYPNGMMMKVYRDAVEDSKRGIAKAFMYKTWEINPNVTEDYLRSICANDMTRFYRDFANMPEVSGGVQFPEGVMLDKNIPNLLQMDFKNLPFNYTQYPHVISIDPAFKNDAFGISCAYRNENEIVVDGVCRFQNSGKGEIGFIRPSDIRDFILNAVKHINVTGFVYDVHIFPELIETLQYEMGLDPIQHIVLKEDYDRWRELQEGKYPSIKLRVVHDLILRKECEELIIKTTPGGKPKCDHTFRGSKDTSDTVANCIWYLVGGDFDEYEKLTPIGNAVFF